MLRGLHGNTLEIYRGHKPRQISEVEWSYYMDRMELDPEGLGAMFWEQVVKPLNEILAPSRFCWNRAPSKVVQIFG